MNDNPLLLLACVLLAIACGFLLGWWIRGLKFRTDQAEQAAHIASLETQVAESEADVLTVQGKYDEASRALTALQADQAEHAELNETLAPITSSLARLERQMSTAEQTSNKSWGQLKEQLSNVSKTTDSLQTSTNALSAALSSSSARGTWGEVQLERLLEHAGMTEHIDYVTQVQSETEDAVVRPDAILRLPDNKTLVIDAKAPMAAYLRAAEAEDPTEELAAHTKALKTHIAALARKEYWAAFEASPEFVVCFLPHESMMSAACAQDPALLEEAAARGVVLCTPATLLAVLRTVAMVWQQERLTHNIQAVFDTGRELHNRLGTLASRLTTLGKSLQKSVESYNQVIGSAESRVFPAAKRLMDQGVASKPISNPLVLEVVPRPLSSPEWSDGTDSKPAPDELVSPPAPLPIED